MNKKRKVSLIKNSIILEKVCEKNKEYVKDKILEIIYCFQNGNEDKDEPELLLNVINEDEFKLSLKYTDNIIITKSNLISLQNKLFDNYDFVIFIEKEILFINISFCKNEITNKKRKNEIN